MRYFWEGAHPECELAPDRQKTTGVAVNDIVATGGSGFGIMALIVGAARQWIAKSDVLSRLHRMLDFLEQTPRYHGMFPHFINGRTGETIRFSRKDNGADLVETTFLFQGLLCARQYFVDDVQEECRLRERINNLLSAAEWNWFTRGRPQLMWHWSPSYGWAMNNPIRGWNECLLTFIFAAGSERHPIDPRVYHSGFAEGMNCLDSGETDVALHNGGARSGPLFFTAYSFAGLDPRGLQDRYANYWVQNVEHTRQNYLHCVANPHGHRGYGNDCWGLTASHGPRGYAVHSPELDLGVLAPSAALSSFPYAPLESMRALRGFLTKPLNRIWGRFGFVDSFSESLNWYARTYLAINQGPLVAMIENYRTGLLWKLLMSAPEVQRGLTQLGFSSPHLAASAVKLFD